MASACGEGWPICRLPRAFCRCLSTDQLGKLQGTFCDGVRKLQRRIISSVVSTETVSKAKTCPSKLEHGSSCSANNDCGAETRLCTCFSSWLGYDCSVEKVDHPDFSISPRVIYHELNLYTTFHAITESILLSSNVRDRAESWTHHVHNTDSIMRGSPYYHQTASCQREV